MQRSRIVVVPKDAAVRAGEHGGRIEVIGDNVCRAKRKIEIEGETRDDERGRSGNEPRTWTPLCNDRADNERRQNPERVRMRRDAKTAEREGRGEPGVRRATQPAHECVDRERATRNGEVLRFGACGVRPDILRKSEPERSEQCDGKARTELERKRVGRAAVVATATPLIAFIRHATVPKGMACDQTYPAKT